MYLLPTEKELNALWRQINPTARIMDYLYSRPPAAGSMAEFFMESEDIELAMEDNCIRMPRGLRRKAGIIEDYSGIDLGEKVEWDEI